MSTDNVIPYGYARRTAPTGSTDGTQVPARFGRLGEQYVLPGYKGRYVHAASGNYFVAKNPTNGTGIAGIAATGAFSDAESLMVVTNTSSAGEGKYIFLDYLKIRATAAGTDGTDHLWVAKIDDVTRYTSGGSAITPVNTNMDSTNTFPGTVHFGALVTASAGTNARLVGSGTLRITIIVVGDTFTFNYGGDTAVIPNTVAVGADSTNLVHRGVAHAPIVLGPGDCYVLSLYAASQSAASSYEFELGMWSE